MPTSAENRLPPESLPAEAYRLAVDQSDLAISITDLRANILYANEAFTQTTGYTADEVVGRNESLLSNHTTPRVLYDAMWNNLKAGKPWSGRLLNRRKNGDLYLAELHITPVFDTAGKTSHFLGMHRDITHLHRIECMVRNQKHLIETVVDSAPFAVSLLDSNGRVLLDNQEYKKLVTDLGDAEPAHTLLNRLQPEWRTALAAGSSTCAFAQRETRWERGGHARWFSCTATLIEEQDATADTFFCGAVSNRLLLTIADTTKLHAEQERGREAALRAVLAEEERSAAIRESLSAALFRLEGPMNVMESAIKLMHRRDPASAELLQNAVDESRAHIDALRQVIPPHDGEAASSVNLNEVLRDVLQVATPALLAAGIVVDWQPTANLPSLTGRPLQLRVLFKALVDNAIEAMSRKGWQPRELIVSSGRESNCLVVRVVDSGPGLAEGDQLSAFEPFYTSKPGHLGTGLSRAQQVVADHHGFIDLDSRTGGCVVTVELPLDDGRDC